MRRGGLLGYGVRLEVGVTQPSRTGKITRDVRSQRGSEGTDDESLSWSLERERVTASKEARTVHTAGGRSCSDADARNAAMVEFAAVSSVRDPAQRTSH